MSGNRTTATWAIDDNPAQTFVLKGHGTNATTAYNQKFFETVVYPFGPHKLTVTYHGDSSKTPLVLRQIILQNDTAVTSAITTHSTSSNTPAIVGGVIGGVAFLLILLVLYVLYRRRRHQQSEKETLTIDEPADFIPSPRVFPYNNPSSRLPVKLAEDHSSGPNFFLSPGLTSPGPSETATDAVRSLTTGDAQSDFTGPSSLVVHQDSGARLRGAGPRVDVPPVYTPA